MLVKNVQSGIHIVDLMVSSSDRGFTSVIDILIHTGKNALHTSNSESSLDSLNSNMVSLVCYFINPQRLFILL